MDLDHFRLQSDLYRRNAFRIFGLSTSVSFKTITRRGQRLKTAIEMNDQDAVKEFLVGRFMGLPDEPTIRSSSSRLGDPRQRLIDELFWLRPPNDEDETVRRLQESRREDIVDLLAQWEIAEDSAEEGIAARATHSLAVFHHMLAIEIEAEVDKELRQAEPREPQLAPLKRVGEYCWYAALTRWRAVLASQLTWDWLHDRALKIDKRRLGPEHVESVRRGAEGALLGIMVEAMIRAAEARRSDEMDRVRAIVQRSGFSIELLGTVTRDIVGPTIEELDSQISRFLAQIEIDKTLVKQLTLQLIEAIEPRIIALRLLLNKTEPALVALEDSFASAANRAQISHWNHVKDDEFSLHVLKRIKPYVHSTQLASKIDTDIEDTLCFFCKERPRQQASSCNIDLWRITDVEPKIGRYSLGTQTVRVSRCESCARGNKRHGAESNRLVKEECAAGWHIGSRPTQDEIRAAFHNALIPNLFR